MSGHKMLSNEIIEEKCKCVFIPLALHVCHEPMQVN